MSPFIVVLAIAIGVILGGGSKTTVILLPDEDGTVGAVSVKTDAGNQTLDKPYHYVTAKGLSSPPSEMQETSAARVNEEFRDILKAQPAKPLSFLLYFEIGSTELTAESRAVIPGILDAIKGRGPTGISIIGHTDTTGTEAINAKVSLERATAVEKILKDKIPSLDNIELQFFGEKELLVPTPPNTPEPRNRRVEVMIL